MYFVSLKKLEADLKIGLTEKENAKYLLGNMFLWALMIFVYEFAWIDTSLYNYYNYIISFIYLIFPIFIIVYTFSLNWWEKWNNFLSRFSSIYFVAWIRIILLAILLIIPVIILDYILFPWNELQKMTYISFSLEMLILILYTVCIRKSFKRLNQTNKTEKAN